MASEKRFVSCCGIHYPLARQFFTPARSSGLARLLSAGSHKGPGSARTCPRSGRSARSSSPSSQHPRIASQTRCPVTPAAAPPSPHHFQPGFPRSARHRQSCCISSAHSPATSDTANRFQADVTEQQRSWRQSESINFMGTDYQTRRDIISTIQTVVYHPLLDIRQSVWVRCYKYPRKGRCSIQHK